MLGSQSARTPRDVPKRSLRATHALIPHWFLRQAVPIYEITAEYAMVFIALCDHADPARIAWRPVRELATEAGVAASTCHKALRRFVELEILEIAEKGGPGRATRYRIPESLPLPAKVIPLPTRRARFVDAAWEAVDDEAQ